MPRKLYALVVDGAHDIDAAPLLAKFQRAGQVVEWHAIERPEQVTDLLSRRNGNAPPTEPGPGDREWPTDPVARSRAIYDYLPNPTFIWQRAGSTFTLADVNEAAQIVSGETLRARLGQTVEHLIPEFPQLEHDLLACFKQRAALKREVQFRHPPNGLVRHVLSTYAFLPPDMVLQHTEDVTEQRRIEEHLLRVQRLEAIGQLAGGVAHDFNNLLTVINGYADSGIESLRDGDPLRADLQEIRKAGEHATGLTRQLLAFSRRQVLEPTIINLNTVIARIEKMLRRLIGEDIDLVTVLDPELGSVSADAGQIEQVVINLVVNARDAMPNGGPIAVETANVHLDEQYTGQHVGMSPGPHVRLTVTDAGLGMDADTKARLFEPFFTTKEQGRGTGLGLATVYGIVKQTGGSIWVYSELGHGTSFKIFFPRSSGEAVDLTSSPRSIAQAAAHEVVLVVEDDEAVRRFATRVLESAGYHVLVAAEGHEAIRLSEQARDPVRLLVTDLIMPQMNGRELAEVLVRRWPGLHVLYVSGYTDATIVRHGMLKPGIQFLAKPFTAVDLTNKVRQVLSSGAPRY